MKKNLKSETGNSLFYNYSLSQQFMKDSLRFCRQQTVKNLSEESLHR